MTPAGLGPKFRGQWSEAGRRIGNVAQHRFAGCPVTAEVSVDTSVSSALRNRAAARTAACRPPPQRTDSPAWVRIPGRSCRWQSQSGGRTSWTVPMRTLTASFNRWSGLSWRAEQAMRAVASGANRFEAAMPEFAATWDRMRNNSDKTTKGTAEVMGNAVLSALTSAPDRWRGKRRAAPTPTPHRRRRPAPRPGARSNAGADESLERR